MIKLQHSQALTSHFESFWSIVTLFYYFREKIMEKYPPIENQGNYKCAVCHYESTGPQKKYKYTRHVGGKHRKVIDLLNAEGFQQVSNRTICP